MVSSFIEKVPDAAGRNVFHCVQCGKISRISSNIKENLFTLLSSFRSSFKSNENFVKYIFHIWISGICVDRHSERFCGSVSSLNSKFLLKEFFESF